MKKAVKKELERLAELIGREQDISYGELAWLAGHKKEVFEFGDAWLAEWAGISESEWGRGELWSETFARKFNLENDEKGAGGVYDMAIEILESLESMGAYEKESGKDMRLDKIEYIYNAIKNGEF